MGDVISVDSLDILRDRKTVYGISPKDIKYLPMNDFSIASREVRIVDGDQDLNLVLFEESSLIYKAYKDTFFDNKSWKDTELFNGYYQAGIMRARNIQELSQDEIDTWKNLRCNYLNYLYKAMRQFGYIQNPLDNFVSVAIGRNGEVILNNGRHRVAAAKLLKISAIPVVIDVVHREWLDFKNSILAYASRHGNKVYAPLKHVDLSEIPARQYDRVDDVLATISPESNSVVDIGAQWGHLCQYLEDEGYECTAVENDPEEFKFLKKLKDVGEYKYDIHYADIYDFVMGHSKFDCVLALSIFHHLAKTKLGHAKMIGLLMKLDCDEMIFQMPDDDEMANMPAYRKYSWREFTKLIIDNSCLNSCKEIGNRETRKMFHLTRR